MKVNLFLIPNPNLTPIMDKEKVKCDSFLIEYTTYADLQ